MDPGHVLVVRFDEILFNRKPDAESDIKFLSLSLYLSRCMAPLNSSAIVAITSFKSSNKKNHFIIFII